MRKYRLSKSRILSGLQCARRLWLEVHRPDLLEVSARQEHIFDIGDRVGEVARRLVPGGVLIGHDDNLAEALRETEALLRRTAPPPLFEATFSHQGVLVRADILRMNRGGAHMVEVKSAASVKDYHLCDCAVQAWVLEGAGFPPERVELAHINTEFVYPGGGQYQGLLIYADITDDVQSLMLEIPCWVRRFKAVLAGDEPDIRTGPQCHDPFECPFLDHCTPYETEYPVGCLYRGGPLVNQLLGEGITDLREIPEGRLAKPIHIRQRRVTLSGAFELDREASDLIRGLPYPRYYLDFETVGPPVPIWAGTRPYQALLFQWSCHLEKSDGSLEHESFLDMSGDPPMREAIASLLETLGQTGPVIVYSGYEKSVLNSLARMFPDLAERIDTVVPRLVDLLPVARNSYYHPTMKGSWSIKSVLPTVAPDLDYTALGQVQDGNAAGMAFLEAVSPETLPDRKAQLRQDLLAYCRLDTLAMVRLARFFAERPTN